MDRLELLLTGVPWSGADAEYVAEGLQEAAADDPTLLADLVEGAGRSDDDLHPELRDTVAHLLEGRLGAAAAERRSPPGRAAIPRR